MSVDSLATAVVSGSSSGIGHAITESLLAKGYRVIGLARRASGAHDHPAYRGIDIDLHDLEALERLCHTLTRAEAPIRLIVSNAGAGHFGTLETFSTAQISQSLTLNLHSHIVLVRHLLPSMKRHGQGGHIVLMGSESAYQGGKFGSLYSAAKFGLRGFSQALRAECVQARIAVCLINPGMVDTAFFDPLSFAPGPKPEHALQATDISSMLDCVLQLPAHAVMEEIRLGPLCHVVQKKSPHSKSNTDR